MSFREFIASSKATTIPCFLVSLDHLIPLKTTCTFVCPYAKPANDAQFAVVFIIFWQVLEIRILPERH
jgi:hypothetical protein